MYWLEDDSSAPFPARGRRRRRASPEVEIVGGGVTGCACALALARSGVSVRLHEGREIAGGASGRNGGFALRGGALPYHQARQQLGVQEAKAFWSLTERALGRIAELADGAFRRVGSLRLAADQVEYDELLREYDSLVADGFAAEWLTNLKPPLAGRYFGAVRHPPDGSLQPARWVRRLASLAAAEGAELREHSQIESLGKLEADQIVIATDGYTKGLLPELDAAVSPTRGQVLVTEPLGRRLYDCPHYARQGFDYWQQTPEGRLVLGGRRDVALETERTGVEGTTPVIQAELDRFAAELIGQPPQVTHRWSGIFGVTEDQLPLAGPVPGRPGLWVACGYSGHGNVLGFACGELVAAAIAGNAPPELNLFDPGRALAEAREQERSRSGASGDAQKRRG